MTAEKMIPNNVEAERALLASILFDPECLMHVAEIVDPDDFYRDAHRTIYEEILTLDAKHQFIDEITVMDALQERGKLDQVGGMDYLAGLLASLHQNFVTHPAPEEYARIVMNLSQRRKLIQIAGKIAQMGFSEESGENAIAQAESLLRVLALKKQSGTAVDIADATSDYVSHLAARQTKMRHGQIIGVPTGFTDLDRMTGGFQKSDLITLAARPGTGKTAISLTMARHIIHCAVGLGFKTLFFSLEMSQDQLSQRFLAMESGIDQSKLQMISLDPSEWQEVIMKQGEIPHDRLWLDSQSSLTVETIRSRARQHQSKYGLDFVIVDYMQLMTAHTPDGGTYKNRVEEVDHISRNLKALARELDIPVLALAQLSRAVEQRADKMPQLSDLRESGGIEQNSDLVIFLYENQAHAIQGAGKIIDLVVAKHRNGPLGIVPLMFRPQLTRFDNLDTIGVK